MLKNTTITATLLLLIILFSTQSAKAALRSWQDNGSNPDWSFVLNWSPIGTPIATDNIVLGSLAAEDTIINQNFTINTLAITNGATADSDGNVLTVKNSITINDAGSALKLSGGSVTGGASLINNSVISGNGLISVASLENNGLIEATGDATLVIDTANSPDLDGTNELGRLEALLGDIRIRDLPSDSLNGTIDVGGGRFVDIDIPFAQLTLLGTTNLSGSGPLETDAAELRGNPFLGLFGTINVDQLAIVRFQAFFGSSSMVHLPEGDDVLQMTENTDILRSATFTGLGRLQIGTSSAIPSRITDGAVVGVAVENHGTMRLVAGPGSGTFYDATFLEFEQAETGTLRLRLGGNSGGEFDKLFVEFNATLDGDLDITLENGFAPRAGDSFPIIQTQNGFAIGSFDTTPGDLPALTGDLQWLIEYNPSFSGVNLRVLTPYSADFDGDGDVDNDDLTDPVDGWQARYGNDLDGTDFLTWQQQLGSGTSSLASPQTVPEPTSFTLCLALLGNATALRRGSGTRC